MSFLDFAVKSERKKIENILATQTPSVPETKSIISLLEYASLCDRKIHRFYPEVEVKGYIVDIHGGGLIAGSVHQNYPFYFWLADQGYVVYGIDYPLIPEVSFREQLQDICCAIAAIKKDIGKRDKPCFLFADSAGALLGLFTIALTSGDSQVRDDFHIAAEDFVFDGAWLQSPVVYMTGFNKIGIFMAKHYFGKNWKKSSIAGYLRNPIEWTDRYLPEKIVISTSLGDPYRKQAYRIRRGFSPRKAFLINNDNRKAVHCWNVLYPADEEFVNLLALEKLLDRF